MIEQDQGFPHIDCCASPKRSVPSIFYTDQVLPNEMSQKVLHRKDQTPGAGLRSVIAAQDNITKSFEPLYNPPEDVRSLIILSHLGQGY